MTIKSIAKICKAHKEVTRHIDDGGNQWLGFNGALYLVPNLPDCDNEQLAAIFDISPEKYEKMKFTFFECPSDNLFNDIYNAENLIERVKIRYIIDEIEYEPLKTSKGLVLLNTDYLKPFKNVKNGIELYERLTPEREYPFIAVKSGLELLGILLYRLMDKEEIQYQKEIISYAEEFSEDDEQMSFADVTEE